jgi:UDP-GlcNAc:undecaprenyl-phosphate/decaprenyl-phosphate GlcNAc-1-phosphate transferase
VTFPLTIYGVSFLVALLITAVSVPLWRRWAIRHGLVDDPGHRKIHRQPIPLAGGLALLTGMLFTLAIAILILLIHHQVDPALIATPLPSRAGPDRYGFDLLVYGFGRRAFQLAAILIGAIGMVLLGWLDDKHELAPLPKFLGQLAIATLVAAAGVRITLFIEQPLFSYAITILWILTVTNATNFIDNMNGLCAGLGLIAAWAFAWSAANQGQYLVAAIAFLACGSFLGFLPYNFPRASLFLGDAGSHLVGYLLAILAILPHFYSASQSHPIAVLKPLIILGVILADLVVVVWIRWRLGQPFYQGDQNHFSHRLVRSGFSPTTAVLLLWLAAAVLGAVAFL